MLSACLGPLCQALPHHKGRGPGSGGLFVISLYFDLAPALQNSFTEIEPHVSSLLNLRQTRQRGKSCTENQKREDGFVFFLLYFWVLDYQFTHQVSS